MNRIGIKTMIPLLLLVALLVAGVIYYTKHNNNDNQKEVSINTSSSNDSSGIVLGNSSDANGAGLSNNSDKITDGATYNLQINNLRTPINTSFQDLSDKAKYTTLFSSDDIGKIINNTRKQITDGIETLKNLPIDSKFSDANQKHLESLNYLLDAINAYDKSRTETDKTEAQKQKELFSYSIDKSNSILKDIQVPK